MPDNKRTFCFIFLTFLFLSLILPSTGFTEENLSIATYYPSPYGVYKELRANKIAIGDDYVDKATYCWGGSCTYNFDTNADLIVEGTVGIGTTSPAVKLHVDSAGSNAAAFMNGNVGIGTLSPLRTLDVAGFVKAGNPYFIASSTDCWRSSTGWTTVIHNQVIAGNSGGWYGNANGRFTAPVNGLYLFNSQHYIYSSQSGAAYIHHTIGVNGNWNAAGYTSVAGSYTIFGMNMGTYDSSTHTTTLIYLSAGDYVTDNVYVSSAAYYMCGYHSYFQGVLLFAQ